MGIIHLSGQHALVCGGTQGIGRAVAHELALLGASVTILARDPRALDEARSTLPISAAQAHHALACDMSDTGSLAAAMTELVTDRPVDILINNTGGPSPGPAHEADTAAFLAAFTQHLIGFQTIVRAVVPGMKARKHGRIVNVISTSVKQPLPNLGVSNTIRGAVANWGKTLATELGPFNITVNNVLPGATSTDRLKAIIQAKASRTGSTEEEVRTEMLAEIPLRRFAEPAEIAAAVAFLAGPTAAYINGINLPVDGGRTACL
ncbi:MAG: SDR family oxidoreductase [Flavobacteriales bacterium]|nr:SDR family oxidoreductase [Flavobacteriales bacterium]